jgi:hypothetical protein
VKERTEEEVTGMLPIEVTLGKEVYKIPALPIQQGREWRVKFHEAMQPVLATYNGTANFDGIKGGFAAAMLQFPEVLFEMLLLYAGGSLDKEKMLTEATDEQVAAAFSKVMIVAYPFVSHLTAVTKVLQMEASLPPSAQSTK